MTGIDPQVPDVTAPQLPDEDREETGSAPESGDDDTIPPEWLFNTPD